jgi:hypothetical protein
MLIDREESVIILSNEKMLCRPPPNTVRYILYTVVFSTVV